MAGKRANATILALADLSTTYLVVLSRDGDTPEKVGLARIASTRLSVLKEFFGLDIHEDIGVELTAISDNDRIPLSDESAVGDPTKWAAASRLRSYVIAGIVGTAPATLDTLGEIADALGDDPNLRTTLLNAIALKANIASPTFAGNPSAPTQGISNDSTRLATTGFTHDFYEGYVKVQTDDPSQADIDALPDGGIIDVVEDTAYVPS